MNSEEKFKESLNHLLSEKEFAFQPAEWPKAEAIIDAERKSKRRFFIFFFLIGLFIGGSTIFIFNTLKHDELAVNSKNNTPTAVLEKENKMNDIKKNKQSETILGQANKENIQQSQESKISTPEKTEDNTVEKTSANEPKNTEVKANTSATKLNLSNEKSTAANVSDKPVKHISRNPSKAAVIGNTKYNIRNTGENTIIATKIITDKKIKNKQKKSKSPVVPSANKADVEVTKASDPRENSIKKDGKNDPSSNSKDHETPVAVTKKDTTKQDDINVPPVFNYTLNTQIPAEKTGTETKTELSIPVKTDSSEVASTKSVNDLLNVSDVKRNIFSIEAGANYLFGWKNDNVREGNGFNGLIGLNYTNLISEKIALSIGIQYNALHNFKNTVHTAKVTRYKFGEESEVTSISALKMRYIAFPLKLHYSLDPNNFIGVGYNLLYLMDVQSKVETYTEKLNTVSNFSSVKSNGYRGGFNNLDGQISVFYRRNIYKEFYINGELFFGTKDIKNNTEFNSNVFERNMGLKLTLNYNFLKK